MFLLKRLLLVLAVCSVAAPVAAQPISRIYENGRSLKKLPNLEFLGNSVSCVANDTRQMMECSFFSESDPVFIVHPAFGITSFGSGEVITADERSAIGVETDYVYTADPAASITDAGSGAVITAAERSFITNDYIYWNAGEMVVDSAQCAVATAVALVIGGPTPLTIACTDNDAGTISGITVMPDEWDGGTVTFTVALGQISAATTVFDMDFEGQCIGSTEAYLAFAGTGEQSAAVTLVADDDAFLATTAAVTLNGSTCAGGDIVSWRGAIDGGGGNTSVGTEVVIVGVKMEFTLD